MIVCLIVFFACKKKVETKVSSAATAAPVVQKKKLSEYIPPAPVPKYKYTGDYYRDPFVPLAGSAGSYSSGVIDEIMDKDKMKSLYLKGIVSDTAQGNIALITDPGGNSYVLKNGKLYNRRNRTIIGISGMIGKESVTLFGHQTKVELKLKKYLEDDKDAN